MSLSLYEICIPNYLQTLNAVSNVLQKGVEFNVARGGDLDALLELRLHETMAPMRFQIISVMHHSLGAIQGIQRGEFNPPPRMPDQDYEDFQRLVADTTESISALSEDDINSLEGTAMKFKSGDFEMPFLAENFLLSFSLPNFYFHATTAYDLLRKEGVELRKSDYLGRLRKIR